MTAITARPGVTVAPPVTVIGSLEWVTAVPASPVPVPLWGQLWPSGAMPRDPLGGTPPVTDPPATTFSVFGATTPGTGGTIYADGGGSLRVGNRFYTNKAIRVLGARIWNPAASDSTFLNTGLTVTAYTDDWTGAAVYYSTTIAGPIRQTKVHTAARIAGAWTDVLFDTPFTLPPIVSGATGPDLLTLMLQFAGGTYYVAAQLPDELPIDSTSSAGTFLAEASAGRGVNSIAGGPVSTFYGIDVLFEVV